ncbi:segregation/condensation protein A [Patescibacteria group bacterium]|nr:segregation/condensation protein A [Patescibacteria group bacterium]
MYKIKLEQFEGPLDLLLQLIEQEKLDITTISLANITDQYLSYLADTTDLAPEELADFLVVAAKLLLIKSKTLLPQLDWEEEDEGSLETHLRIYKEYLEASYHISKIIRKKKWAYPRETLKSFHLTPVFNPPKQITTIDLRDLFIGILKEIQPVVELPQSVVRKTLSIKDRIGYIQQLITDRVSVNFLAVLKGAKTKTDIVVTFLALLELVKQRIVVVTQPDTFSDIIIKQNQVKEEINE